MPIRLHVGVPLVEGAPLELPEEAARHAQVRRVQPGDVLRLFDGCGAEHEAQVLAMGRREVVVRVGVRQPALPELAARVTLAVGMPANERMDFLVEKATELGVAAIQPLHCARSVLRLQGERAQRRAVHWQAVAVAAAEQCGRAVVPKVLPVRDLVAWCAGLPGPATGSRLLLSLAAASAPVTLLRGLPGLPGLAGAARRTKEPAEPACGPADSGMTVCALSGPEGGLTAQEEETARAAGFVSVSLGPRVLRADTAPLALLAWLALSDAPSLPPDRSA